jgi:hypothetical protein
MFSRSFAVRDIDEFRQRLLHHLLTIRREREQGDFVVPVGLFLVLDEANGGNSTAEELIRRFGFLDLESRQVIDFYFLGWRVQEDRSLAFDLGAFQACRDALRTAGVREFGGYADLILVDAWLRANTVSLDFEQAIRIDLFEAATERRIANVGGFLQSLIQATEQVRVHASRGGGGDGLVERISDRLGVAIGKASLVDYILETWGRVIGGRKLMAVATRRVGPVVDLKTL